MSPALPTQQGSGYGGGGAGGGERTSDNFTNSCAGSSGVVHLLKISTESITTLPNMKVDVNGTLRDILAIPGCSWMKNSSTPSYSISKLALKLPFTSRTAGTRCLNRLRSGAISIHNYTDFPDFEIGTLYHEFASTTGFKSNFNLHPSKLIHENKAYNALYSTTTLSSPKTFAYATSDTFTEGTHSIGLFASDYHFFILQAGGGGGGGADNSWGLFNYAAGGGGGGGGGARCILVKTDDYCECKIHVGGGGNGGSSGNGSRPAGSNGGDTYIELYGRSGFNEFNTKIGEVRVTGGGGGGGANGNSAGGGGSAGKSTTWQNDKGYITSICVVDGGSGGHVGTGNTGGTSGDNQKTLTFDLFDITITVNKSGGSGGTVGSQNDRGGGGGSSWLGNGGHYFY